MILGWLGVLTKGSTALARHLSLLQPRRPGHRPPVRRGVRARGIQCLVGPDAERRARPTTRSPSSALREAKAVVVLWSKHSVDSRWVRAEATQADRHGTLVPVMIEPCKRPIMFELTHTADLSHWKGDARLTRPGGPMSRTCGVYWARTRRAAVAADSCVSSSPLAASGRALAIASQWRYWLVAGAGLWHLLHQRARTGRQSAAVAATTATVATGDAGRAALRGPVGRARPGIFLRRPDRGNPEPAGADQGRCVSPAAPPASRSRARTKTCA